MPETKPNEATHPRLGGHALGLDGRGELRSVRHTAPVL